MLAHGALRKRGCDRHLDLRGVITPGHTTPEWHALTRPSWGAVESTLRMAGMAAKLMRHGVHRHMNAGGEADMLKYARERGVKVTGPAVSVLHNRSPAPHRRLEVDLLPAHADRKG
ncbi:hypothetical protein [Candidatus Villigracilis saccharophilus]|uniref:hypothetical protein n=1 Tax=Candidatus Villigracilis saccharophilus TaxID=3140684 RepID=UPI0031350989|nr:hypothetical protein [Anaerolineales bacterium]